MHTGSPQQTMLPFALAHMKEILVVFVRSI